MRAYNKRLNHITEIRSIDFEKGKIRLVQPGSKPTFVYEEQLVNVEIQESTNVVLGRTEIFVGDILIDEDKTKYRVEKVAGGFFPFIELPEKKFKKAR